MRLLPVLDLRHGQVVHACGGRRTDYQPLTSCWTANARDPLQLLQALQAQLGCRHFYVADLDALEGRAEHRNLIGALIQTGFRLWLDAGIRSWEQAQRCIEHGAERVIIASETLPCLDVLTSIVQHIDSQRIIVSLDFFQGGFLIPFAISVRDLVAQGTSLGLSNYILLDTAQVGKKEGPQSLQVCRELKRQYPSMFLTTGGGVRDGADLDLLAQSGVDVALVATALHQGLLNASDFVKYPFASELSG